MQAEQMIRTHPDVGANVNKTLVEAIEAAYACAQACTTCADACLAEEMVRDLRQCIRSNLDCADVCVAAAALASRRTGSDASILRQLLETCSAACGACAAECERHADKHEHCRICAQACRRCEIACRNASTHL